MNKPSLLDEAQEFFFRGMIGGWAAGGKKIAIPELPGYKGILFEEEHFRLLDRWCVTPFSNKSDGGTTIWWREFLDSPWIPVWVMHYAGWYEEEAIPLVQAALTETYAKGEFRGCRGPGHLRRGDLLYTNTFSGRFDKFAGWEGVIRYSTNASLGVHEYSGMSLL